jgi:hypothetical protein
MCEGNNLLENKQHLKKSIAKMMVYWVVNSRHNLRDDLLANDPTKSWAGLDFKNAFGDDPATASEEFNEFFRKASILFNLDVVKSGSKRINERVHGADGEPEDWCDFLQPECPDNRVLNVMFNAAMAYVDNTDWEGMTAVSRKLKRQAAKKAAAAHKHQSRSHAKPTTGHTVSSMKKRQKSADGG